VPDGSGRIASPAGAKIAVRCGRAALSGCVLSVGLSGAARAQPADVVQESARALADEGANAYAAHDDERALALFQRAYMLVPAPTIALFEARTLARLGRLLEARAAYLRLIRAEQPAAASAPFRNAVETGRAELAELAARIPRLHIAVAGELPPEATVLLDGRPLPAHLYREPLLIDPGAHSLRLKTARDSGELVAFVVAEGQSEQVRLAVPRQPAPDPRRTWSFVLFGASGAGLAVGVVAGAVALGAHDDAESGCPDQRCEPGSAGAAAAERFRDWRTVSTVGYVAGALCAGAGVALLLTSPRDRGAQVAVVPAAGGGSVVATW
jgi:hypothetical protein